MNPTNISDIINASVWIISIAIVGFVILRLVRYNRGKN